MAQSGGAGARRLGSPGLATELSTILGLPPERDISIITAIWEAMSVKVQRWLYGDKNTYKQHRDQLRLPRRQQELHC